MNNLQRILVLGSSSWLGYLLIERLKNAKHKLAGTFFNNRVDFGEDVEVLQLLSILDCKSILKKLEPTVIINFLRGEDEQGMLIHSCIIDYAKNTQSYYLYASSVLALEGYKNIELTESLIANGNSKYGFFKANCEQRLYNSSIDWCIVRFASVQGWVPHKLTRNEKLLQKLSKGEAVIVDREVVQNRMFADLMVEGIIEIIEKRFTGIIHFGTSDSSEEIDFLREQAELFGFSPNLIVEGTTRKVNLVAVPNRIYSLLGSKYRSTQGDTLDYLSQVDELQKYIN